MILDDVSASISIELKKKTDTRQGFMYIHVV